MPAMGESVSEGVILEWAKQPGDAVEADETIVEISTDKVDAEVPAPASGTVAEILAQAGDTVNVGQVIARIAAGDGAAKPRRRARAGADRRAAARRPEPTTETPGRHQGLARRRAASPPRTASTSRRSTAAGPAGRISKADVLAAADGGNGATATAPPPRPRAPR